MKPKYKVLTSKFKRGKNQNRIHKIFCYALIIGTLITGSSFSRTDTSDSEFNNILSQSKDIRFHGYVDSSISLFKDYYLNNSENISDINRFKSYLFFIESYRRDRNIQDAKIYFDSAFSFSEKYLNPFDTSKIYLLYQLADYQLDNNEDSASLISIEQIKEQIDSTQTTDDYYTIILNQLYSRYYSKTNDYKTSITHLKKALDLCSEDTEEMTRLSLIIMYEYGSLSKTLADYDNALLYLNKSYDRTKELYGEKCVLLLQILANLGHTYKELSEYEKADSLFNLTDQLYGEYSLKDHSSYNEMRNNKAVYLWTIGRYSEVEALYKEIIKSEESRKAIDYKFLGGLYINLANFYYTLVQLDKTIEYYNKTIELWKDFYDENHLNFSKVYNNMAVVYGTLKKYDESENYQLKALKIREVTLGPDHPDVALTLSNLADLYTRMGKIDKIEPLLQRSLDIRTKNYGEKHRHVAKTQQQLATFYANNNIKLDNAEELFNKSLATRQELFSPYHNEVSESYYHIANFYLFTKDYTKSYHYFKELLKARQDIARYIFSFTSEDQKLKWLSKNPLLISSVFNLARISNNEEIKNFAFETVLKAKAIIGTSLKKVRETIACNYNEDVIKKHEQYISICEQIADIALNPVKNEKLEELFQLKDSLEVEIARECTEFNDFTNITDLHFDQLSPLLDSDKLLLDYVKYYPDDHSTYRTNKHDSLTNYLVFSLDSDNNIQMIDLGSSQDIDNSVQDLRENLNNPSSLIFSPAGIELENRIKKISSNLYSKILKPVLNNDSHNFFYIAPDGLLNLLPFEILYDSAYLIENNQFCYLNSGRDILNFTESNIKDIYIFADPNLNEDSSPADNDVPVATRSECFDVNNLSSIKFTRKEGEEISKIAESKGFQSKSFYGSDFSESNLKNLTNTPDILHLATHGYFCSNKEKNNLNTYYSLNSGLIISQPPTNPDSSNSDIGIFSALEIASMNLQGTDLVTLSACNTGVGGIVSGEGVFGLRRSFQNAGAQAMVLSLWEIPDNISYKLMKGFYSQLFSGKNKNQALRESALDLLKASRQKYGHAHPLLWGGFIQIGNPQ